MKSKKTFPIQRSIAQNNETADKVFATDVNLNTVGLLNYLNCKIYIGVFF